MEKDLNRQEIEHLIIDFLKDQPLCVIATCSENIPRATTVEFFPAGTTIYILTEGGKKVENIMLNPHVSIAIHAPFAGWKNVRGLQITGIAEVGKRGSNIFEEGLEAYKIRRGSQSATVPEFMSVIKVKPSKMEYVDTSLGKEYRKVKYDFTYLTDAN